VLNKYIYVPESIKKSTLDDKADFLFAGSTFESENIIEIGKKLS